jgi:hypothetical protein
MSENGRKVAELFLKCNIHIKTLIISRIDLPIYRCTQLYSYLLAAEVLEKEPLRQNKACGRTFSPAAEF